MSARSTGKRRTPPSPDWPEHPAKWSDSILDKIAEWIRMEPSLSKNLAILDPCGGVGKIGALRQRLPDHKLRITSNDIEPGWAKQGTAWGCDHLTWLDASISRPEWMDRFDLVITSFTYGNRMSDHHKAKDGSKRFSYFHCYGVDLSHRNTGLYKASQDDYWLLHEEILATIVLSLRPGGRFILNMSDHIKTRKVGGEKIKEVQRVSARMAALAMANCFVMEDWIQVATPRLKQGQNHANRMDHENIFIFRKDL